ncbi:hypothetical protein BWQ96_04277 [Gracilariopsis chorda]|uniref:CCHC-type domain-containing protein n=1 Tax=Gracilariopsis chorda TaxID=448386 RepID=A0A2V3IV14_9FLOR|nr:hypothetical protein BWQ96_04277 [Gracilariopsis chorda]|eukprot:PXF45964.1 hypothetical protein BWQ96_04277 [Gracilariopsis chorda]
MLSQASIDALLERYQDMRMDASESVLDYINRLAVIQMKLGAVGHTVSDAGKLRAILRGLTNDFDVTAEVVNHTATSLNDAVPRLIAKESQLSKQDRTCNIVKGHARALHTRTKKSGTKSQNDSRCFFCKKKGHKMRNCWHNPESKNYKDEKKRCDKDHDNRG